MTFDRDQLIEDYAQQLIEGMDYKTMERFVYDTLIENLSTYSNQTLMEHISEYSPELLGDVPVEEVAQTP